MVTTEAEQIKEQYLNRLRRTLMKAPADIREDAVREVETHIDDEWQASGRELAALGEVLQRLGRPEDYGRDLALQLMLARGQERRSIKMLLRAALFWISTSLAGSIGVILAALLLGFALGMLYVAGQRALGNAAMLIDARDFQIFAFQYDRFRFPSEDWSPAAIALAGLLPALISSILLFGVLRVWLRSRLASQAYTLVLRDQPLVLVKGWERRALWTMSAFALLGMSACILFSLAGSLVPVGRAHQVELPQAFFQNPLSFLAFLGLLVFLGSPVLGLLLAIRKSGPKSQDHS